MATWRGRISSIAAYVASFTLAQPSLLTSYLTSEKLREEQSAVQARISAFRQGGATDR